MKLAMKTLHWNLSLRSELEMLHTSTLPRVDDTDDDFFVQSGNCFLPEDFSWRDSFSLKFSVREFCDLKLEIPI